MANMKRDAERETFWRAALRRQPTSGLSVRAFCRREKLTESNFYAWRRTIAQRDQERAASVGRGGKANRPKSRPAFLPVAVCGRPEHEAAIVLERAGGLRLRFAESISADRVAAIVHALEAEAVS